MSHKSPLHDLEEAQGAHFEPYHGWEPAGHFGDALAEYESVRHGVGALDMCYLGKLRATGRDRVRYFHSMLSNDIKSLGPGTGCHATLLTHQGRMESDLYVYAFPEVLWVECPPAGTERVFATLNKYIIGDVLQIEDWSDKLAVLSLQGPQSREKMESSTGIALGDLPPLGHKMLARESGPWVVIHRDRTGCDGYDLWLPKGDADAVWTKWTESVRPAGHQALNWLRTEAGIPWFGVDMQTHNLPMEFGLDSAISLRKGCYRGQEIVARVVHRGHLDRCLCGIAVDGKEVPAHGSEVYAQGERVGEIASAIHSPRLGRPLALAVVKKEFTNPGTPVTVQSSGIACPGEVVALPLREPGQA